MRGSLRIEGPGSCRQFTRRRFLGLAAALGMSTPALAAALAACGQDGGEGTASSTRPPIEQESADLVDFTWAGNEDPTLYKPYTQEFPDAKIRFAFMTDQIQAYAKVAAGYAPDVIHTDMGSYHRFQESDLIQPWDTSLLTNYPNLITKYVDEGKSDGKQYVIPTDWGYSSVMYRSDKVEPLEESWSLLWDERYAGKITWWDTSDMLVVNAYVQGFDDPYSMTDDELEVAKRDLIAHKKLVRNMWASVTDMANDFAAGNIWITYAWPSEWLTMSKKGLDVVYASPVEGREVWVEGKILHKSSDKYYHAHKYADAWSSPETSSAFMSAYAYGGVNKEADLSEVDPRMIELFHLDDPAALETEKVFVYQGVKRPKEYARAWDEVKAAGV